MVYNTLPFGWKISPFVYHTTGLLATNLFRSIGIPCSLYIDDRHNGQLQVDLHSGAYFQLPTLDERNLAAANSAIFIVAYYFVQLGYFLGLAKSTLIPVKVVPFLGFLSDSALQVFHLIPLKRKNSCYYYAILSVNQLFPSRHSKGSWENVFHFPWRSQGLFF